jgi:hypothetical protein
MAEFGMVRSFDIDDGQLDGLRPQEIFVLGYELALVMQRTGAASRWSAAVRAVSAASLGWQVTCRNRGLS